MSDTTELLDTTDSGASAAGTRTRRSGGLSALVLPDLKAMATSMGIKGISGMRKGDLIAAISAKQTAPANGSAEGGAADRTDGPAAVTAPASAAERAGRRRAGRSAGAPEQSATASTLFDDTSSNGEATGSVGRNGAAGRNGGATRNGTAGSAPVTEPATVTGDEPRADRQPAGDDDRQDGNRRNRRNRRDNRDATDGTDSQGGQSAQDGQGSRAGQQTDRQDRAGQQNERQDRNGQQNDRQSDRNSQQNDRQDRNGQQNDRDDDGDGRGGRRRNRYRDRNRRGRDQQQRTGYDNGGDTEVREDDVLVPVAGILDVLDSYAFVRTSGYLSGPNDVYVSLSQVRKNGLRRGDHVTGVIRAPREGEQQRQKFNALVRLDTVNGLDPELARNRPEFTKLTPLYPNERLRLETESHLLTTRVIDLVMPVGKGQRALIVSPPKAGKTMVMQAIANAITTNNPECHLMVVLVDERPEEVTDMQRSVKGEVIASTFDRPPADHTMVAELSIERAKRLVEMGKDVVVLLDSITRLGRAYNLAAPASGRILSGGVDSTALFPPKRFLGAARNIENGGSLTIFASALVETGSAGDTVIFEEFKGTGNAELRLDRRLADKRIFPAIDVDQSSTRKEDLLMAPDELAITVKLRRVLSALDAQQALELVLDRLRKSQTNIEFLMQVAKNTPGNERD
ncbi:MAG: transcription termination factor Rho [Actinomycetota bacterium]|nr:transcription termination factor Rho [Actinomycetota bacterium]